MYVAMIDGLPGICANIDADIKPRHGGVILQYLHPELLQQLVTSQTLIGADLEVIGTVAFGNYQRMQRRDRKAVADRNCKLVLLNDSLMVEFAEDAFSWHFH